LKVIKKQIEGQSEIEVEVHYTKMDSTVHGLIKRIERFGRSIYGTDNGRQYKICEENRIEGVKRFSRVWAIPKDAEKPADPRHKDKINGRKPQ